MTEQDKQLLLQDLCARLPYGVNCKGFYYEEPDYKTPYEHIETSEGHVDGIDHIGFDDGEIYIIIEGIPCELSNVKPYLRPMSSMTEEEKKDLLVTIVGNEGSKYFRVLQDGSIDNTDATIQDLNKFNMHWIIFDKDTVTLYLDWLNKHHFDFRNLIERGLAIDCTGLNIY